MTLYAVGDVQGCFDGFIKLIKKINFDPKQDQIILLGDTINRGHQSIEMIRFIMNNPNIKMVLGNHEIYVIALYLNAIENKETHTVSSILNAKDNDKIFAFLRKQPLLRRYDNNIFVHAGILPSVSITQAIKDAKQVGKIINSSKAKEFLSRFFLHIPQQMSKNNLEEKLKLTLSYLCYMRMCRSDNTLDLKYKGSPIHARTDIKPWFDLRDKNNHNIFFGHWAALGVFSKPGFYCLDSGYVWGNKLTAMRIDDKKIFQVSNV